MKTESSFPTSPVKDAPDFSGLSSIFDKAELVGMKTATAPASPVASVGVSRAPYVEVKQPHDCPVSMTRAEGAGWAVGYNDAVQDLATSHSAKDAKIKALEEVVKNLLFAAENADESGYVTDVGFMNLDELHESARAALALPCA